MKKIAMMLMNVFFCELVILISVVESFFDLHELFLFQTPLGIYLIAEQVTVTVNGSVHRLFSLVDFFLVLVEDFEIFHEDHHETESV